MNANASPRLTEVMIDLLIIGYGNPLRGDDGVGWHVVEALDSHLPAASMVTVHQLTPEWSDTISRAGRVIFVDAALGDSPGKVEVFPLYASPTQTGSHETTPGALLGMAGDLFGRCPPAFMVTIVGASFELSEALSAPVAKAVPVAVSRVLELAEQSIV